MSRPHNIVITRDVGSDTLEIYDLTCQVVKEGGSWSQIDNNADGPIATLHKSDFKKLYGYTLKHGMKVDANTELTSKPVSQYKVGK